MEFVLSLWVYTAVVCIIFGLIMVHLSSLFEDLKDGDYKGTQRQFILDMVIPGRRNLRVFRENFNKLDVK